MVKKKREKKKNETGQTWARTMTTVANEDRCLRTPRAAYVDT